MREGKQLFQVSWKLFRPSRIYLSVYNSIQKCLRKGYVYIADYHEYCLLDTSGDRYVLVQYLGIGS